MTDPVDERAAIVAEGLTEAQRDIMLGHMVEIPPEDADDLIERGLKGRGYFHGEDDNRRMVWPITPLGLAVRAHLIAKDQTHD